jgi:HSP20 family protein
MEDSAVDVFEEQGALMVEVDLPGVCAEDVAVKAKGSQLRILAHRRAEAEAGRRYRLRGRRSPSHCTRDLILPPEARLPDATATLERGVLRVRIPLSDGNPA